RIVWAVCGLRGRPAARLVQIAARHHVTSRTVSNNAATVRVAGARLPLSAPLIVEATRVSAPRADHLSRVRIATTLGLPAPPAAVVDESAPVGTAQPGHVTVARAAVRGRAAPGAGVGRPGRGTCARRVRPVGPSDTGHRDHPHPARPGPEPPVAQRLG